MPKTVDPMAERRKFNQSLELATQKQKIRQQKEEIAKLNRALKEARSLSGTRLRESGPCL